MIVVLLSDYRNSKILDQHQLNPLSSGSITVRGSTGSSSSTYQGTYGNIVVRVGTFLVEQLRIEYEVCKRKIFNLTAKEALSQLTAQFNVYLQGVYPFNHPFVEGQSPRIWWLVLQMNPHACVLAVRGYPIFTTTYSWTDKTKAFCNLPILRNAKLYGR